MSSRMHSLLQLVLILFVLVALRPLGARSHHKGPMKRNYDKLENHLRSTTRSRDVATNMEEIHRLHGELSKPLSLDYDPVLKPAVEDFVKLDQLPVENPRCDQKEHNILIRLARYTDGHKFTGDPERALTSVEKIFYEKSMAYTKKCLLRYPDMFRSKAAASRDKRADAYAVNFFLKKSIRESQAKATMIT